MSYDEFLKNIHDHIGEVVEFTSRRKSDGKIEKYQRIIWSANEYGELSEDAPFEIINVERIR